MSERIEKPWGHEEILEKTDKYVVKKLFVKAGRKLSYQYHNDKLETMLLLSGDAILILDGIRYIMRPWEPITIEPHIKHRLDSVESNREDACILEVSTPELDDVIRIEDDYGRTE